MVSCGSYRSPGLRCSRGRSGGSVTIAKSGWLPTPRSRWRYELKKRWQDGTTAVVMPPQVLMERLCALVPRPRRHLVTYHGAFAPAAGIRPWIVPQVEDGDDGGCRHGGAGAAEDVVADKGAEDRDLGREIQGRRVPHLPGKRRRGRPRYSWADLMRRVFLTDVLVCERCGGTRRLLAAIHDPAAIRKVLGAMGLSAEVPVLAQARSPPRQAELPWE